MRVDIYLRQSFTQMRNNFVKCGNGVDKRGGEW